MLNRSFSVSSVVVAFVLCATFSFVLAGPPDAPNQNDPNCATCECLEASYWWTNGDQDTQQIKYWYNIDDWYPTTYAISSGKAPSTHVGCKTGTPAGDDTTVRRYSPTSLKRICNGAATGNKEILAAKNDNQNHPPMFPVAYSRFVCP